jgi:hypothetical protein
LAGPDRLVRIEERIRVFSFYEFVNSKAIRRRLEMVLKGIREGLRVERNFTVDLR